MNKEEAEIFLEEILSESFIQINKTLVNLIGINEAYIFCDLKSKEKYFKNKKELTFFEKDNIEGKWFFNTYEDLQKTIPISVDSIARIIKKLKKIKFINVIRKGNPAKNYYQINHEIVGKKIINFKKREQDLENYQNKISEKQEQDLANCRNKTLKIAGSRPCKKQELIYNNIKPNNIKPNNNKNKNILKDIKDSSESSNLSDNFKFFEEENNYSKRKENKKDIGSDLKNLLQSPDYIFNKNFINRFIRLGGFKNKININNPSKILISFLEKINKLKIKMFRNYDIKSNGKPETQNLFHKNRINKVYKILDEIETDKQLRKFLLKSAKIFKQIKTEEKYWPVNKKDIGKINISDFLYNSFKKNSWFLYTLSGDLIMSAQAKDQWRINSIMEFLQKKYPEINFLDLPENFYYLNKSEVEGWDENKRIQFYFSIKGVLEYYDNRREDMKIMNQSFSAYINTPVDFLDKVKVFREKVFPEPSPNVLQMYGKQWNIFVDWMQETYGMIVNPTKEHVSSHKKHLEIVEENRKREKLNNEVSKIIDELNEMGYEIPEYEELEKRAVERLEEKN